MEAGHFCGHTHWETGNFNTPQGGTQTLNLEIVLTKTNENRGMERPTCHDVSVISCWHLICYRFIDSCASSSTVKWSSGDDSHLYTRLQSLEALPCASAACRWSVELDPWSSWACFDGLNGRVMEANWESVDRCVGVLFACLPEYEMQ